VLNFLRRSLLNNNTFSVSFEWISSVVKFNCSNNVGSGYILYDGTVV